MSSNRVHYLIKNILQNSKLNREKFVNNKKIYNLKNNKINSNLVIKRKFGTYIPPNDNIDIDIDIHNENNNNKNDNNKNDNNKNDDDDDNYGLMIKCILGWLWLNKKHFY